MIWQSQVRKERGLNLMTDIFDKLCKATDSEGTGFNTCGKNAKMWNDLKSKSGICDEPYCERHHKMMLTFLETRCNQCSEKERDCECD